MDKSWDSMTALWMWPLTAAKFAGDWLEMMTGAVQVIEARMPMIAEACLNPSAANHAELSRMVTEKVEAFSRSNRSVGKAKGLVQRVSNANARALGHVSGGGSVGPAEWLRIFQDNLEMTATLALLPMATLGPVRARVAENARRLGR